MTSEQTGIHVLILLWPTQLFCFWQKGRVLYKRKATLKLIAVAYMIDAILEIKNDDLDAIYHCDEPQLKTLSNIVSI